MKFDFHQTYCPTKMFDQQMLDSLAKASTKSHREKRRAYSAVQSQIVNYSRDFLRHWKSEYGNLAIWFINGDVSYIYLLYFLYISFSWSLQIKTATTITFPKIHLITRKSPVLGTHGNVFLRFCIVYCSQGHREQPANYLKQYKNAWKRFRVYGA